MSKKNVDFKRENDSNPKSKKDMDLNVNFATLKTLKYKTASVNFLGQGPFNDDLVISYDY